MSTVSNNTVPNPASGSSAGAGATRSNSYGQILKSSALIGGSSVLGFAIGAVRTKAMAVLLGPAGFGINGLFYSILDLGRCFAAMGITTSGVRQIAAAVGSGDETRIARTVIILRRIMIVLGILSAALMALLARPIAEFTFQTETSSGAEYTLEVAILGLGVMLFTIAGGQDALIQGTRRIGNMALISILCAVFGVAVSVPLIYWFRERGIVPSIVCIAAFSCALSWWFGRKVRIKPVSVSAAEVRDESVALLKLGLAFLASGLLTMGASYAVRTIVFRMEGEDAAGFYQSAWGLAGMYAMVVLQAMGADFYPRLTAVADDHEECNRLVNEQSQVSLLLAGPGLIATLTLAPFVIAIFYSPRFEAAVEPLRWICLGMALRVVAWPLGYVIVAKAQQVTFVLVEILATAVHIGLAFIGVKYFGVRGAAMAFLGLYLVHCTVVYLVVRRSTGFRWSAENIRVGTIVLSLTLGSFLAFEALSFWPATAFGIVAATGAGVYALRRLTRLVPMGRLPGPVRKLAKLFGLAPGQDSP